jgi:hypothetical protein
VVPTTGQKRKLEEHRIITRLTELSPINDRATAADNMKFLARRTTTGVTAPARSGLIAGWETSDDNSLCHDGSA